MRKAMKKIKQILQVVEKSISRYESKWKMPFRRFLSWVKHTLNKLIDA
jgi:hypothetical protein